MSAVTTSSNESREKPRLGALVALFFAPTFVFANMYTTQAMMQYCVVEAQFLCCRSQPLANQFTHDVSELLYELLLVIPIVVGL